tara:strand:- start:2315 stop:2668 length:354 start_codon:yes stop_codon:yes gene_type:complete
MILYAIVLVLSVLMNIFLGWYIKESIERLMYVSRNIGRLADVTMDFKEHITHIGEMEIFYGDETIVNLIKHTDFLSVEIDKFNDIYSLSDYDQEELEDDGGDETEEEEEKTQDEQVQ